MEKITNVEIKEMIESGKMTRGAYQRTPSHDEKVSTRILTDIYNGVYAGVLHFSTNPENGIVEIIDGSSRIADVCNFYNGNAYIVKVAEMLENDKIKKVVQKIHYSELSETEKSKFDSYEFPVQNIKYGERMKAFVYLNSSVVLSNIQKFKGDLDLTEAMKIFSTVQDKILTATQVRKDEAVSILVNIIATVNGCYNSSYKRMTENIVGKTIDLEKFSMVCSKITASKVAKYDFIATVEACMLPDGKGRMLKLEDISKLDANYFDELHFDTSGANSGEKNVQRIKTARAELNKLVGVVETDVDIVSALKGFNK